MGVIMATAYRGSGLWDVQDRAEVMVPSDPDWDERDLVRMSPDQQRRLLRFIEMAAGWDDFPFMRDCRLEAASAR
jgi:hypothetical protein